MPYDPERDITLKRMQEEARQLNRELRMQFDEVKFEQLSELHIRIRARVAKQIQKHGAPIGWEGY